MSGDCSLLNYDNACGIHVKFLMLFSILDFCPCVLCYCASQPPVARCYRLIATFFLIRLKYNNFWCFRVCVPLSYGSLPLAVFLYCSSFLFARCNVPAIALVKPLISPGISLSIVVTCSHSRFWHGIGAVRFWCSMRAVSVPLRCKTSLACGYLALKYLNQYN